MSAERRPLFHLADSYRDSDQYYLTGFLCPDPFATIQTETLTTIAVPDMEAKRAERETRGVRVLPLSRFFRRDQVPYGAVTNFVKSEAGARIRVLPSLSLGVARAAEGEGIQIDIDEGAVRDRRRRKSAKEIKAVESVQRKTESAMEHVRAILAGCRITGGFLQHQGHLLTAEKLRSTVEGFLLERGLETADSIFASGRGGADPHWRGTGPIRANTPIVVDLFPRDRSSRYHSDMSRTFVVGRASAAVRGMHDVVKEAQDAALDRLSPGTPLADVHRVVCDVFIRRGFAVPSQGKPLPRRGLLHGTGHGLGLDVHESPTVSVSEDVLMPGDVITIEPGLYDRRVGGVRIEDVVAVMPDGEVRNLTRFDRELEIL